MTCENCGMQIPENETKCPKCGTDNFVEELYISAASAERVVPHGFSVNKNIIIIIIAALLALGVGGTAVALGISNMPANRISRYMGAAERYLSEMNYEQAVIEFQRVLEIDPMNVDAYLGLAEAYLGLGDTEKALEILREGFKRTEDGRLRNRIDEFAIPNDSNEYESDSSNSQNASEPAVGNMGSVTILGEEYDIATTTYLNLSDAGITDDILKKIVPEIKQLINLTLLSLDANKISDVTPLAGLANLGALFLDYNQISDITPLVGLTNMWSLSLMDNQISDITPLAGLTNLGALFLDDNQISDITPLVGLTNLEHLGLMRNQISDITPLANLTSLTDLSLEGNQISDVTPLAELTNLTGLCLNRNQISDIMPLAELTNLTGLCLNCNQISDIMPLAELTNLTDLDLNCNQISDIMALVGLTNLQRLYLWDNQIRDITPLAGLTNLQVLYLGNPDNNQISDITPLAGLTNLEDLHLYGNQISKTDIQWIKAQLPNCDIVKVDKVIW